MAKRLGKRMLKSRWEAMTGEWLTVAEADNRANAEMWAEMLKNNGIPASIRLIGALAGLGGYPFGTSYIGSTFAIEVPQNYIERAKKIFDSALSEPISNSFAK